MTPSQRKAINKSKTMRMVHHQQKNEGETILKKIVTHKEALKWVEAQIQTETMVFDWVVTQRGRIVHESFERIKQ